MFDYDRKYYTLNKYIRQCMTYLKSSFSMGVIRPKSYNTIDKSQRYCMKWTDEDNNPSKCKLSTLLWILVFLLSKLLEFYFMR